MDMACFALLKKKKSLIMTKTPLLFAYFGWASGIV